ncbi:MAG: lipopolysaccharide biosynthesis protein [Chloroflexi bacterium]|nr:lipopolysaccharide biosynthesis protein [Chloroflexota bacterium]
MRKLLLPLLVIAILFLAVTPASADATLRVYYAGADGGVKTALELADFTFVDDPAQADVLVLNGVIPDPETAAAQVDRGAGLALILGPDMTEADVMTVTGVTLTLAARDDAVSLTEVAIDDPLTSEIIWNGAPQVRERFEVQTPVSSVQPLVTAYEDGEWILWRARPNVYVFQAFLGDANPQIQEWAYFNYLVYHLVERAAGRTPLSFAEYPASPVPHAAERTAILGVMALALATTILAFILVRRYSRNHPEALEKVVADRARFEVREAGTKWEQVGFHRPLSGFLVALSIGLVLFIPLIIYQNLILPSFILPSAQALGIWGRVVQFFTLAWNFFDMGTSIAFIKYLSQRRVDDPKKGIQYGQVFVWWQILSGAVQVALVVGLASTMAPRSAYALYAWSVIIHALIQLPGCYQVFRHALTGFQRLDYSRFLDIGLNVLFPMIVQPVFVVIMFSWGRAHPVFGGAMGGLLGMGVAAYAAELLTFGLGWWLYRRVGYGTRVLFLAHFDWEVVKTSFRFGVFEMLGSAAWSFGQAMEIAITQARLINYTEIWGNWMMAQNFIFAFNVTQTLNDGVMPAISEAISHGKRILSQYYSVMAYKYNGLLSAFIGAVLLAVAPKFIIGSTGVEFERAALYVIPLTIWGAVQFPSWVGDNIQLGANKPYLKSILVFSEQVIRVALAWFLIARFQVAGLIIAYFIGLFAKGIAAYAINNKVCFPQRFFSWQSLVAPLLAGAAHFGVLSLINGFLWKGDQITSVLIFFLGILPSFPLFMFFYGLFGGWDKATLAELGEAAALTGGMRWMTRWGIYEPTRLGARLSPLNGRFPITNRPEAMEEAEALTEEKVKL